MKTFPRALPILLALAVLFGFLRGQAFATVTITKFLAITQVGNVVDTTTNASGGVNANIVGASGFAKQTTTVVNTGDILKIISSGSYSSTNTELHVSSFEIHFTVTDTSFPVNLRGTLIHQNGSSAQVGLQGGPSFLMFGKTLDITTPIPSLSFSFSQTLAPGDYFLLLSAGDLGSSSGSFDFKFNVDPRWTNRSQGDFQTAGNWNSASVPTDTDTAIFDLTGKYTVRIDSKTFAGDPPAVARLVIENGSPTFIMQSGALKVLGDSSGNPSLLVKKATLTLGLKASNVDTLICFGDAKITGDAGAAGALAEVEVLPTGTFETTGVLTLDIFGTLSTRGGVLRLDSDVHVGVTPGPAVSSLLTVNDGGRLEVGGALTVGEAATGDLFVSDGAEAEINDAFIGVNGEGFVQVAGFNRKTGKAARLTASTLNIGTQSAGASHGEFLIDEGGEVFCAGDLNLGVNGSGEMAVTGAGARLLHRASLNVDGVATIGGSGGFGQLTVDQGGQAATGDLNIGTADAGFGQVTIGGSGQRSILVAESILIGSGAGAGGFLDIRRHGAVEVIEQVTNHNRLSNHGGTLRELHLAPSPISPLRAAATILAVNASGDMITREQTLALRQTPAAATPVVPDNPTLKAPHVTNDGLLALGGADGLIIDGDFEQTSNGTIVSEIFGPKPGKDFSQLKVTGSATLGGKVVLQFMNGFAPKPGQKFDFVAAPGAPTGDFASIDVQGLAPGAQFSTTSVNGIHTATSTNLATALPTVSLRAATPKLFEKKPKAGGFVVSRSGKTTAPLTVTYSIGGSATNGSDYPTLSGSVTIPVKKKTATIVVTAIDDPEHEQPETVELAILPTADYTHSKRSKAKLTIIDND